MIVKLGTGATLLSGFRDGENAGVIFSPNGNGSIGGDNPEYNGKSPSDIPNGFLTIVCDNPDSARVLIRKLEEVAEYLDGR